MDRDKKIMAGVGIAGGITLAAVLASKAQAKDKALLIGMITNAETGQGIGGIQVTLNGYSGNSAADGSYQIRNIEPGEYDVAFVDPQGIYEPVFL